MKIEYARREVREVEVRMTKEKNHSWGTALRYAFPKTIPVMVGYLFLGTAYGILMSMNGFGVGWAFVLSVVFLREVFSMWALIFWQRRSVR